MAALNGPAPTDLRVNLLKADREEARRALAAEGVAAKPTPLSPVGLRLRERVPLGKLAAFEQGLVEVQDESSQIAALARRCETRHAGRRFLRRGGRQDLGARRRNGQSRQARRLRGVATPPRPSRAPAAPSRRYQCRAPCVERRARQMGQAPRRQLRPGLRRCALPRHRDVAAQSRRQMAHDARGSRRARRTPAADPAQRRAPRPPRRAVDLRDLLVAARGGRGAGRSLSRRRAGFRAVAGRARLERDDRRRLAGRRGLSPADPRTGTAPTAFLSRSSSARPCPTAS